MARLNARLSRGKPIEPVLLTGKHIDQSGERFGTSICCCVHSLPAHLRLTVI